MVWENRARCVSRQVTRHSLSAHSWDSLAPHPDKPSVSSHEKIVVHMSSMNWLSHPVLSSLPTHADKSSFLLSPHFAHKTRKINVKHVQQTKETDKIFYLWQNRQRKFNRSLQRFKNCEERLQIEKTNRQPKSKKNLKKMNWRKKRQNTERQKNRTSG